MQMAVSRRRAICAASSRNSTEFGATSEPVVGLMTEWMKGNGCTGAAAHRFGRHCRLGAYRRCSSAAAGRRIYGNREISSVTTPYEVNPPIRAASSRRACASAHVVRCGVLPEMIEFENHPWLLAGLQFPRAQIAPVRAAPLFASFVGPPWSRAVGMCGGFALVDRNL